MMRPAIVALQMRILTALAVLLLASLAEAQEQGIWDRRIEEDARRETFTLTARKPNYILVTSMSTPNQAPYEFTGAADRLDNEEVKFQLAFQTKVADDLIGGNGDLWFGYTQVSFWQLFNGEI
jgi:phospholipase A1